MPCCDDTLILQGYPSIGANKEVTSAMTPTFATPSALNCRRRPRPSRCMLVALQTVQPGKSPTTSAPHPAPQETKKDLVMSGARLFQGLLVRRPNRFIFNAIIPSISPETQIEAHSPAVGKISGHGGEMAFSPDGPVRALLSEATGPTSSKRRTKYTVEAIDIGAGGDNDTPVFCGINQTKSNSYLAHFLELGSLPQILPAGCTLRREVTSPDGKSRIDLVAERPDGVEVWIENKTMLRSLPIHESNPAFVRTKRRAAAARPEASRMLKHWETLRSLAATAGKEAVVVLTHLMEAERFDPEAYRGETKAGVRNYEAVRKKAESTRAAGVRFVQVNFVFERPDGEGRAAIRLGSVFDVM